MSQPNLMGPSHLGPEPASGDTDLGPLSFRVSLAYQILVTIFVAARFVSRGYLHWNYWWDDWTMLIAYILATANFAINVVGIDANTFGRHIYYLSVDEAQSAIKLLYISEFISLSALCFTKVSVALCLFRIGKLRQWVKMLLIANTVILVGSTIGLWINLLLQCRPISANWNFAAKSTARCTDADTHLDIAYLTIAISIFTDFVCAILPFPMLRDIKTSKMTRNSLMILMSLGFIAGVCGIVRITHVKDLKGTSDITYASTMLRLWTGWELNTGIIVGSAPPCRGLVLKLWGKYICSADAGTDHISNGSEHTSMRGSLSKICRVFGKSTSNSRGSPNTSHLGWVREGKSSGSGHTSDQSIIHADHQMRTSQKAPRLPEIVITQDRDLYQVL